MDIADQIKTNDKNKSKLTKKNMIILKASYKYMEDTQSTMSIFLNFDIAPETFRQEYLYQKPKLFKNAVINLEAVSWDEINGLYQRANPAAPLFHLRKKGVIVPKEEYVEIFDDLGNIRHHFIKPVIYEHMRNGASLIYNHINNEPFSDGIARQIGALAQAHTVTSAYLCFGSDESYKNHWDTRDVYAVQLVGKKRWYLSAPNFPQPLYMQQTKDLNVTEPDTVDYDIVLEAGDVLYIPRGWWHNPIPMGCESFHLAVGTFPPNGYDYLEWLMWKGQGKIPEIESLRHSFTDWQTDKERLVDVAEKIACIICSPERYAAFLEEFLGEKRTDSIFNLEKFANPQASILADDLKVRLNTVNASTAKQGLLIANGTKINAQGAGCEVLAFISTHQPVAISKVLAQFDAAKHEEIRELLTRLADLDAVEVF